MKRTLWTAVLVAAFVATTAGEADAQMLLSSVEGQTQALPGSKVWGKDTSQDVTLELHYPTKVKPLSLRIGRNHPNGIKFLLEFKGAALLLPVKFDDDFEGIDGFGDLKEGYLVEAAEHDFDGDGTPELLVAVGNGLVDLAVNVFRYHAPAAEKEAGRAENWSLEGKFTGQSKAHVDGDSILLPYGSQGLFEEYTWVKNKFVKTE